MKGNNKGFSLVELLVSFAILSVVTTIVLGIVVSGTNMFNKNKRVLSLQYKSQIASAQFHSYLQNCDGGVAATQNYLWVVNTKSDSTGEIYLFCKENDSNDIFLKKFNVTVSKQEGSDDNEYEYTYEDSSGATQAVNSVGTAAISNCAGEPMCSSIESWSITIDSDENNIAHYASITLNLKQEVSTYSKTTVESFRNRPVYIHETDPALITGSLVNNIWG